MRTSKTMTITMTMAAALSVAACAGDDDEAAAPDAGAEAVQCPDLGPLAAPEVPQAIQPPAGSELVTRTYAFGTQIYTCQAASGGYAWTFKAPDAVLYNESCGVAGSHGAGPFWTWKKDGSTVIGKKVADVPAAAGNIPWLLLEVQKHEGAPGLFSDVTHIQRVATDGGTAPTAGCDASTVNTETSVGYTAVYYFWK